MFTLEHFGEKKKKLKCKCCGKGDPFQGLKMGSCLTFRNELSEETHMLTKQKTLLGRGPPEQRAAGGGDPGEVLCHVAHSPWFCRNGVSFWVVCLDILLGPHLVWPRVLGSTCTSAKMSSSAKDSGRLGIFSLFLAPPKIFWLVFRVAPCSLSGPPVVRQLM